MYLACVESTLLYSLHTSWLRQHELARLNAFDDSIVGTADQTGACVDFLDLTIDFGGSDVVSFRRFLRSKICIYIAL